MQKYDKSLVEVEEWKEKVYQEIKDLTKEEFIEYFRKGADRFLSEHGIKLKQYRNRKPAKVKDISRA
jgi:hypothetical protein